MVYSTIVQSEYLILQKFGVYVNSLESKDLIGKDSLVIARYA